MPDQLLWPKDHTGDDGDNDHPRQGHSNAPRTPRPSGRPATSMPSDPLADVVAAAPATRAAISLLRAYAHSAKTVVLVGATGTGKTRFAELLHRLSDRSGAFTDVTAGELHGELAGDMLFGHERGAFTGATGRRPGLLAATASGTLLIDDFQGLDLGVQARVLRVFDGRGYRRLGVDANAAPDCRLVIGLNAHPDQLVAEGRLLPDLRGRLGHGIVELAPLAERREEIPLFARRFLAGAPAATRAAAGPDRFARGVIELLALADWPGNVRDLRESVYHGYLLARADGADAVCAEHLPRHVRPTLRYCSAAPPSARRRTVEAALAMARGNAAQAARLLGVHRVTVLRVRERGAVGG